MAIDACTPRPSMESSNLDSSGDNARNPVTDSLLSASAVLLNKLQPSKKLHGQSRLYKSAELKHRLKEGMRERLKHEANSRANSLTCTSIPIRQQLCTSMLSSGKPKSFIEFFNLTQVENSRDSSSNKDDGQESNHNVLSSTHLSDLSKSLVETELAIRKGDSGQLSHLNFQIASVFEDSGNYSRAVYYLSRSLIDSKKAGNLVHEAKVKFNLGKVYVKLGDYSNAKTWFEEYLDYTRKSKENDMIVLAATHLLEVYQISAKEARCNGDLDKSINLYEKCIEMADICSNMCAKAEAKHHIGLLQEKLSRFDIALQFQTDYLQFCIHEKDEVGQSKAYASLAKTHEHIGNIDIAIQHLESLLEVSKHVNLETQAKACCNLGMMYKNQCLYEKALQYFEMFFKIACTLANPNLIDAARLDLGYVKSILQNNIDVYRTRTVPPLT